MVAGASPSPSQALRGSVRTKAFVALAGLLALCSIGYATSATVASAVEPLSTWLQAAVSALTGTGWVASAIAAAPAGSDCGSIAVVALLLASGRPLWLTVYLGCKATTLLLPKAAQLAGSVAALSPFRGLYAALEFDAPATPDFAAASLLAFPRESLERAIHPYLATLGLGWVSCPTLEQIFVLALACAVRKTWLAWPVGTAAAVALLGPTLATGRDARDVAVSAVFAFAFMAAAVVLLAAVLQEATALHDDGILASEEEARQRGLGSRRPPAGLL